ncbi:MAG: polymorphic toxin type 50 domain-containing protein [Acutalibacteraceae bacterium]
MGAVFVCFELVSHCTAVYLCTSFSGTPKADGKEMYGALFLSPDTLDEQFGDDLFPPFADSLKMLKSAQIMQTLSMNFSDGGGIIKEKMKVCKDNNIREFITLPEPIGEDFDTKTDSFKPTKRAMVKYSKKGIHFIPVKEI